MDWHDEAARGCDGKRRMGERAAHSEANRQRATGERVTAYRCPWGASGHWHVGHVPSMEAVERIAAAIRARAQDPAA